MNASIEPLKGKYYGTIVTFSDEYGESSVKIWRLGNYEPSDRQLSDWGLTRKQWDENALVENGWGGKSGCRTLWGCDSHYETLASYKTAERIVSALANAQTEPCGCLARKVPSRSEEKALSVTSNRIGSSAWLASVSSYIREAKRFLSASESFGRGGVNVKLLPSYLKLKEATDKLSKEVTEIRRDLGIMPKSD